MTHLPIVSSALASIGLCAVASAQTLEWLSQAPGGAAPNGALYGDVVSSADGRWVAFNSLSSNLVANDGDLTGDTFVLDRTTGVITLVSLSGAGQPSTGWTSVFGISDDGRWVGFTSYDLEPGPSDDPVDIYLHDRTTQTTVEVTGAGENPERTHKELQLSGDGRLVAWESSIQFPDSRVLIWNRTTGTVVWVRAAYWSNWIDSTWVGRPRLARDGQFVTYNYWYMGSNSSVQKAVLRALIAGGAADEELFRSDGHRVDNLALSADGRFSVFNHAATAANYGLWLRDNQLGVLERLDPTIDGTLVNAFSSSYAASVSDDGMRVAFLSRSAKFVPGDTNGEGDAFVRDRLTQRTLRVSVDANGAQLASATSAARIASDGQSVDFAHAANGLVPSDTNNLLDVFRRVIWGLDGGAYCNSAGAGVCAPTIDASGTPSAGQSSGYVISVNQLPGQRAGLMYYGASAQSTPFAAGHPSTLCVAAPRRRMSLTSTGGTAGACDGALSVDMLAWAAQHPGALLTPLTAGQTLRLQGWYREPSLNPGAALSRAWSVTLSY
jgi:hypothetical protein